MSISPPHDAAQALLEASGRGVHLWVEDRQLRFRAPEGSLDAGLRAALTAAKPTLIDVLPGPEGADDRWHPLSGSQRGFWFSHRLFPESAADNLPFAATVDGPFDPDRLVARLHAAVARCGILRTTFASISGTPVQRERAVGRPAVERRDARRWSVQQVEEALHKNAVAPFDLHRGPLLRLLILDRGPEQHVLALTLHHAVGDLSSMSRLLRELTEGAPADEAASFGEFARLQADRLASSDGLRALSHWRSTLEGASWDLDLPVDCAAPDEPSHVGGSQRFVVPPALADRLSRRAADHDATLYSLLLTSLGVLLQRWTGQDDLLIGSPVFGRFDRRFEGTLGPLVDVLPLRLRVPARRTFSELVSETHTVVTDALSHAEIPFARLVQDAGPPRDAGRTSTLRLLFAFQSLAPGAPEAHRELVAGGFGQPVELGGATWTPRTLGTGEVSFDLSVTASRSAAGVVVVLDYRAALFDPSTVDRLSRSWLVLLEAVAEGAELPGVLPAGERGQLLGTLSHGVGPQDLCGSVDDLVAGHAGVGPDRLAYVGHGGSLTYGELDSRAADLAARLPARQRIGVVARPGPDLLVSVVAILRAGSAFVPLGDGDPLERRVAMLDDAQVSAVVASSEEAASAEGLRRPVVCIDSPAPSQLRGTSADGTADPDPLVYIVFTSGSTGRPKGVPITASMLAPVLGWGLRELGLGTHSRVLQNLSVAFDFGVFELLTTLAAGGTLCVPGPDRSLDGILDFARRHRVDTLHTTPSWARLLLAARRSLPSLRVAHFGGEVLPVEVVERLLSAMHPDGVVVNGYGPTEATINCTMARFDRASIPELRRRPSVPIGAVVSPFRVRVLDDLGEPTPLGGRGELFLGGPCVAPGYLGDVDDSAFLADPHEPTARLYRTGDVVRLMPSGELLFCGRRDRQVQLRGRRLELASVEAALELHPGVERAAVDVRPGPRGPRLVAWIVWIDAPAPGPELRGHALRHLPAPEVPALFLAVPALPTNRAGKLDRAALTEPLRRPSFDRPLAGADTPVDPLDVAVLDTLRAVLCDPTVGPDTPFFERGDSLLAVEAAHRLGRRLGVDVPGNALFRASTSRDLASLLRSPPSDGLLAWRSEGDRAPLFVLSPGELELPSLRRLAQLLPAERPVLALELRDAPDLARLLEAYADSVLDRQPDGAIHLLGYCVGGQLAYALASTLEARGRDVALVVLVDAPFRESRAGTLAWRAARRVARRWRPTGRSLVARFARGLFLDPGIDRHALMLAGWEPPPWQGRAVYLMARRSHFRLMPTRRRWQRVTSPPMVFEWVPGDHDSVLEEPHVRTLAARLGALLS